MIFYSHVIGQGTNKRNSLYHWATRISDFINIRAFSDYNELHLFVGLRSNVFPNKSTWNIKNKLTEAHLCFCLPPPSELVAVCSLGKSKKKKGGGERMDPWETWREGESWKAGKCHLSGSGRAVLTCHNPSLRCSETHTRVYTKKKSIYSTSEIGLHPQSFLLIHYSTFISYCVLWRQWFKM